MNPLLAQVATSPNDTPASELLANLSVGMVVLIALCLTLLRLVLLSLKTSRPGKPAEVAPMARGLAEILESLIIAGVLVFLIIRPFFVQAFYIPSASMENTLLGHDAGTENRQKDATGDEGTYKDTVHDHIFVNKLVYRYSEPQRGDIIVFKAPKRADAQGTMNGNPQENVLIKRLIGIPGDKIEVKPGKVRDKNGKEVDASIVYRNDKPLMEYTEGKPPGYIKEPMDDPQPPGAHFAVDKPIKLGPNELFVMGDNRNDSNDSRFWGTLERNRVIGKASLIFFPFNRLRFLH